jgi:hypothetical protein
MDVAVYLHTYRCTCIMGERICIHFPPSVDGRTYSNSLLEPSLHYSENPLLNQVKSQWACSYINHSLQHFRRGTRSSRPKNAKHFHYLSVFYYPCHSVVAVKPPVLVSGVIESLRFKVPSLPSMEVCH